MEMQTYFSRTKALVDEYSAASFVLEAKVSFEARPGNQGYVAGSIRFLDHSVLYFKEFLDLAGEAIDKLMYSYHYQDRTDHLVFRYDNARHKPSLTSSEHKHLPGEIILAPALADPTLTDILAEIITTKGWV